MRPAGAEYAAVGAGGLAETDPTALVVEILSLILIFTLRFKAPRVPGALVLVAIGIIGVAALLGRSVLRHLEHNCTHKPKTWKRREDLERKPETAGREILPIPDNPAEGRMALDAFNAGVPAEGGINNG